MSHTPNDSTDRQHALPAAFNALGNMLDSGRSFSGRERNCCFLNTLSSSAAGHRFANISATSGFDFPDDGRALALVDWDQDGDQDAWISNRSAPRIRFLRNDVPAKGHFLGLRLVGNGKHTNRDAIGARVEVVLEDGSSRQSDRNIQHVRRRTLLRTLRAGEGFLAQSSKWLHFGLGASTRVVDVVVHWPNGSEDRVEGFGGLVADRRYELVQGTGRAKQLVTKRDPSKIVASQSELPAPSSQVRLPLLYRLPVHSVKYKSLDSTISQLSFGQGRPVWIHLWSSTCRPCIEELSVLSQRESDLRQAGIHVVAISVDPLIDPEIDSDSAQRLLASIRFPFAAGLAPRGFIFYLQGLHSYYSPLNREFPLPTSFLIDEQGRLAFIYKGPVKVDQLLRDAQDRIDSHAERWELAAHLPGRSIRHPVVQHKKESQEIWIRFHLAEGLRQAGQLPSAILQYRQLLILEPNLAKAHNNLGLAYRQRGDLDLAKASYERSLQIDPNSAESHNNLGVVLFRQGQILEAKSRYERALQIDHQYVDASMNLGIVYEKLGQWKRAESHFRQVLQLSKSFAKAELHLGIIAEKQGKLTDAARHYQNAQKMDDRDVDVYINLGVVLARLGRLRSAQKQFEQANRIDPNQPVGHNNLGLLMESQGRFIQAKAHYQQALRVDPHHRDAQANLRHVQALIDRE